MRKFESRIEELKNMKIVSIDAETNGLWGDAFAVAAVVYDEHGTETDRFVGRCPISTEANPWVEENVLPKMNDIPETHPDLHSMLVDFFTFLKKHKDAKTLCHMGHIVEANLLRQAHEAKIIGDWDAPYEWFDVCILFGDSVDGYREANGIALKDIEGGQHNPVYDCISAYRAFRHFIEN